MNDVVPQYPWDEGDHLFASALNAAIANGPYMPSGGAFSLIYFGGKSDGTTDDVFALNTAIATIIALPHGGKIILPAGRTVIGSAIVASIPAGKTLTIEGMGPQASELYFPNASDGLGFTLLNSGNTWGAVSLQGFTLTRGPTVPASANTGIRITADLTVNKMCAVNTALRDLVIKGSVPLTTNQWQRGLVLDSVGSLSLDNVTIYGVNGTTTDLGDVLLTINGLNAQKYAASINVVNSIIQGGSAGVDVTGYAQGIFIANSSVIGQYDSVRWNTIAATLAEELAIANASLAAHHRGVYTANVNQTSVAGTTVICFGASAGYAGIELNHSLFCSITGNNVVGSNVTGEAGIILSDCGANCGNTVVGNVTANLGGGAGTTAIAIRGTTSGATIVGNSVSSAGANSITQAASPNAVLGNTYTGAPMALTTQQSAVFYNSSSGLSRWFVGNDQSAESGADTGNDFQILRAHDNGTLIDGPIRISRATGTVTIARSLTMTTTFVGNYANDAAAAAAGVPIAGIYRNGSVMMIRVV